MAQKRMFSRNTVYHAPNQNKPIEFCSNSGGPYAYKTDLIQ